MLDILETRSAASTSYAKARAARTHSLADEVIAAITFANADLPMERRVTPRTGLTVASRALSKLSALPARSQRFAAMRAVNSFITLATSTSLPINASASAENYDLLPLGHPSSLSAKTLSTSPEKLRLARAQWLAADPEIAPSARVIVAAVFSTDPDSIAHVHALARLDALAAGLVPSHIKLTALTAAGAIDHGMASAARRARVALQLRDSHGRWIDMGHGLDFHFFDKHGAPSFAHGDYVGADAAGNALIEVRGNANLPNGIYPVHSSVTTSYEARLPGGTALGGNDAGGILNQNTTPKYNDLVAARLDAPAGWTERTTDYPGTGRHLFQSDDGYQVTQVGENFSLFRLDKNGDRVLPPVATGTSWGDMQNAASADEAAHDATKSPEHAAKLEKQQRHIAGLLPKPGEQGLPDAEAKNVDKLHAAKADKVKNAAYNEKHDALVANMKNSVDENGNTVPSDWTPTLVPGTSHTDYDAAVGRGRPQLHVLGDPSVQYKKVIGTDPDTGADVYATATVNNGKINAGYNAYDSWDQLDTPEAAQQIVDWENRLRGNKNLKPLVPLNPEDEHAASDAKNIVARLPKPDKNMPDPVANKAKAVKSAEEQNNLAKADKDLTQLNLPGAPAFDYKNMRLVYNDAPGHGAWEVQDTGREQYIGSVSTLEEAKALVDEHVEKIYGKTSGTKPSDEEIYNERMQTGASLQEVAKKYGMTREQVRQAESRHAKVLRNTPEPETPANSEAKLDAKQEPKIAPLEAKTPELADFADVPAGAFQLRGVDYEPEGRIDEESTDFDDDPEKLATKFTPQELIKAMTQALTGNSDASVVNEILNANIEEAGVDENGDPIQVPRGPGRPAGPRVRDISEVDNTPGDDGARLRIVGNPPGAGQLEFNGGQEWVQAEAIYQAIYQAGMDPNRVIADIYDSVNGNTRNFDALKEAATGNNSPKEKKLVDDIMGEVSQKNADSKLDSIVHTTPDAESIELDHTFYNNFYNEPFTFGNNPDYHILDTAKYDPQYPDVDEDNFTDNPEHLAKMIETADLIDQLTQGVTDGSGAATIDFGTENSSNAIIPVEAIRDALQLQGVNTNTILQKLEDAAPSSPEASDSTSLPEPSESEIKSEIEQAETEVGEPKNIENVFNKPEYTDLAYHLSETFAFNGGMQNNDKVIAVDEAHKTAVISIDGKVQFISGNHDGGPALDIARGEDWFTTEEAKGYGWRLVTPEENDTIHQMAFDRAEANNNNAVDGPGTPPEETVAPAAEVHAGPPPPLPPLPPRAVRLEPAPAAPQVAQWPGPREHGYSPRNVAKDRSGTTIGAGSRVKAALDGKQGIVISIENKQNNLGIWQDYVRVRTDDGTIITRSARKLRALDPRPVVVPPRAAAPTTGERQAPEAPEAPEAPATGDEPNIQERLRAPLAFPQAAVNDGSVTPGVENAPVIPASLAMYANPNIKEIDFMGLGPDEAAQIAYAGRNRVSLESLDAHVAMLVEARVAGNRALTTRLERECEAMLLNMYGDDGSDGATFGHKKLHVTFENVTIGAGRANGSYNVELSGNVRNSAGVSVGSITRSLSIRPIGDDNGTRIGTKRTATHDYLKLSDEFRGDGFATAYNHWMENWYYANGVSNIHVTAAAMAVGGKGANGALVWGLQGFSFSDAGTAKVMAGYVVQRAKTPSEKKYAALLTAMVASAKQPDGSYDMTKMPTPFDIALAGWRPGKEEWIGQKVMMGMGWSGDKKLDPKSLPLSRVQYNNYRQIRNADARVAAGVNKPNISHDLVVTMNTPAFAQNNPKLRNNLAEINQALSRNDSLAVLSPSAKTSLNSFVTSELLKGDASQVDSKDLAKLRRALNDEYAADNPGFGKVGLGVGQDLKQYTYHQIDAGQIPGFTVRSMGRDGGVNSSWMVTHDATGQVFFVKRETLGVGHGIDPETAEAAAGVFNRAMGLPSYATENSNMDPDTIIMRAVGADMPIVGNPVTGQKVYVSGITGNDGKVIRFGRDDMVDHLSQPEDVLKLLVTDILMQNHDRHSGNYMFGVNADDNKLRLMGIDHTLASFKATDDRSIEPLENYITRIGQSWGGLYGVAMPQLLSKLGSTKTKELLTQVISDLLTNIRAPNAFPAGDATNAIVAKWGSVDAFIAVVEGRLTPMITRGTTEYNATAKLFKKQTWS